MSETLLSGQQRAGKIVENKNQMEVPISKNIERWMNVLIRRPCTAGAENYL